VATPSTRRFLVLHGWQNRRPQQHWQWQLAEALRASGEQVLYPQLPQPDAPSLRDWNELLTAELAQLGRGERVVIAHSLAVLLWLHHAPTLQEHERVDRVLLVAPPSPAVLRRYPEVEAFADVPHDRDAVAAAARSTHIVCSDNDPYCPEGAPAAFAALDLETEFVLGGGHLDPDSGYGAWPSILQWCHDPTTRLTPR
jgi:predicted alpha/beta hydrolase family esterase